MSWLTEILRDKMLVPVEVDPDIPDALDLIGDPGNPAEAKKVIPVALANSVIKVTCPKWQGSTAADTAQAFVLLPGGDPEKPNPVAISDAVEAGDFVGDFELLLDLADLRVAAGSDLAFDLYVAQGSEFGDPYVSRVYRFRVDKQVPGGGLLPPPIFADEVIADGVTPARLLVDGEGIAYLPASVMPYFRQAPGDVIFGLIDGLSGGRGVEVPSDGVGLPTGMRFDEDALLAAGDGDHSFTYDITDRAGNRSVASEPVQLHVRMTPGDLLVRGARTRSAPFYYRQPAQLTAQTAFPGDDVVWWYPNAAPISSRVFADTRPADPLWVGLRTSSVVVGHWILRPGNIAGAYNTEAQWDGGCVVKDDGSLHGWGGAGVRPPTGLGNVVHIATTRSAYAALIADGTVVAWGDPAGGGTIPAATQPLLRGVTSLAASGGAFAALLSNGSVVAWGASDRGATIPGTIAGDLRDVEELAGSDDAFAARTRSGSVFAWGAPWPYGMRVHVAAGAVALCASAHAFAARKANGEVAAWGDPKEGGLIPDPIAPFLKDIVQVASTSEAFAVLRRTGEVFAWGSPRFGGQMPVTVDRATQVVGSTTAFAALSATGEPTCWGEPDEGGTAPAVAAIDSLTPGYGSFVALLRDGNAMSWGRTKGSYDGGDAVAAYAIGRHAIVITSSGKLVTWGPTPLDLSALDGLVSHATPVPAPYINQG